MSQPLPPEFLDELTDQERKQWEELEDHERAALVPCSLDLARRALANRRKDKTEPPAEADNPKPAPEPPARAEETDEERKRKADLARRTESWNRESKAQRTERLERDQRPNRAAASTPPAQPAEADQVAQDLETVDTLDASLSALARLCWHITHAGAECQQEHIPTEADLCTWLLTSPPNIPQPDRWEWVCVRASTGPVPKGDEDLAAWDAFFGAFAPTLNAAFSDPSSDYPLHVPAIVLHYQWKARNPNLRPPHPLESLVKAWQARPTPIEPDRRTKPIIGRMLLDRIDRDTPNAPTLDVVDVPGLTPYQGDLFTPNPGDVPSLTKTLHDVLGDMPTRRGRAPLAAVLWLEGLLSIPTQYRDGLLHSMDFTRRELYERWAGCDPSNFNHREAARQDIALGRMTNTTVSVGKGWYKPLIIQAVEGLSLNSRVSVLMRLPPGTQQGPAVPRQILRKLVTSRLAWLGFLNICIWLDRYGARQGRLIAADRPQVERNEQGQILDHRGEVIRNKCGYPIDRYTDKRAIQTGQREANPARIQYPALDKIGLITLFYPLSPPSKGPQDKRDKWKATQRALKRIEHEGGIKIEQTRTGWRLMPGAWALAKHNLI